MASADDIAAMEEEIMGSDGILTPPGEDGIFGRGAPPQNAAAPPVDGDGTNLRETLMVAYPSPGHMRVARAIRHPQSGAVEFQEEYREPTDSEREWLRRQGVPVIGPGSMVPAGTQTMTQAIGETPVPGATGAPNGQQTGFPWLKVALAVGAVGLAVWKGPVIIEKAKEMFGSDKPRRRRRREEEDEED